MIGDAGNWTGGTGCERATKPCLVVRIWIFTKLWAAVMQYEWPERRMVELAMEQDSARRLGWKTRHRLGRVRADGKSASAPLRLANESQCGKGCSTYRTRSALPLLAGLDFS